MKDGDKPIANPFVILREEFDDWAILFNSDTGRGFGLSPTGVYAWKLLDGEHTIQEMLKVLHRDFQEVPQEASTHIEAFVEELTLNGLVTSEAETRQTHGYRGKNRPEVSMPRGDANAPKISYETPQLINLSGERAAGAYCTTGASGTAACANGSFTSTMNCHTGNSTGSSYFCANGGSAPDGCAGTGSTAATFGCNMYGTSPTGSYCKCNGAAPTYVCGAGS